MPLLQITDTMRAIGTKGSTSTACTSVVFKIRLFGIKISYPDTSSRKVAEKPTSIKTLPYQLPHHFLLFMIHY